MKPELLHQNNDQRETTPRVLGDEANLTLEEKARRGALIAEVLGLKAIDCLQGPLYRLHLGFSTKTALGVYNVVERLLHRGE